jgi:hypothetical protein
MGSGFDEWVNWHFFTVGFDYDSSHIEGLLNDVCLANLSLIPNWSRTDLYHSRIESESHIATDGYSVSRSWCRAQFGVQDQIFITV